MVTLSELINRQITPEKQVRHQPRTVVLTAPILARSEQPQDQYEARVFNFLLDNRELLGVKTIMRFSALLVDGAVELTDGKRLTVEIKYRMNWAKACQAEYQFRNYLKRHSKVYQVDGGLVFFEEFSADWERQAACRSAQNGWMNWYIGHSDVNGLRLDLLRLCNGKLEGFPAGTGLS
jgi:hypothetical protein